MDEITCQVREDKYEKRSNQEWRVRVVESSDGNDDGGSACSLLLRYAPPH